MLGFLKVNHKSAYCFIERELLPVTGVVVTNLSVTHFQTGVATELQLEVDEVVELVLVDTFEVGTVRSLSLEEEDLVTRLTA